MPLISSRNSLNCLDTLMVGERSYAFYNVKAAEKTLGDLSHLSCCLRVLLENFLRFEDDQTVTLEDMRTLTAFHALRKGLPSLPFRPTRVLLARHAAVSTLADLANLRDALAERNQAPAAFKTACPFDMVADDGRPERSVHTGDAKEIDRLLLWGKQAFPDVRLVPPGKGTCSQVNMDSLSRVVQIVGSDSSGNPLVVPDTVLGVGEHLPIAGSLGLWMWPADVLDIESVLLGAPALLSLPGLIGMKLTGKFHKSVTTTDIALNLAKAFYQKNGAGKIVEFYGPGLDALSIADRALIASFIRRAGALSVFFPIDGQTLLYLSQKGENPAHIALVEAYAKAQGLWREPGAHDQNEATSFTDNLEVALDSIHPCLGGPLTINQTPSLPDVPESFAKAFPSPVSALKDPLEAVRRGDVVLAALNAERDFIHPGELVIAGLVARKARALGLTVKPWVRAEMNIPDPALKNYLTQTGLWEDLEMIGFRPISSPIQSLALQEAVTAALQKNKYPVCAIVSGAHRIESPLHPACAATYTAAPGLVVAYALSGSLSAATTASKTIAQKTGGESVMLKEIWPSAAEIEALAEMKPLESSLKLARNVLFEGDESWRDIAVESVPLFSWNPQSTAVKRPSSLAVCPPQPPALNDIKGARVLAVFGNDALAAQMAPSGPIAQNAPASHFLMSHGLAPDLFGSFEERTGNEEVMVRGAFSAPGLVNALLPEGPAGLTRHATTASPLTFFDAAQRYRQDRVPLVIAAGQNYGAGRGQEWAAKATKALGVSIVIAESFAPEHRLNLIRVGLLPLQLKQGVALADLKLTGNETLSFAGLTEIISPPIEIMVTIDHADNVERYMLLCRLDTEDEVITYRHGSFLAEALRTHMALTGG